jgi:hypothetical protein
MATKVTDTEQTEAAFQVFRLRDRTEGSSLIIDPIKTYQDASESTREGMMKGNEGVEPLGAETRCLFQGGGMSILYIWFKSGYPLVRHSHDIPCAYVIIGGSLKLGTEELGVGDGFYVPPNVPYTYTVGEKGMEMLEFRNAEKADMKLMSANADFWARYAAKLRSRTEIWREEKRPSGIEAPFIPAVAEA